MKKIIFSLICVLFCGVVMAQGKGAIVVNSETIFKAIPNYTSAMEKVDKLSQEYQKSVDAAFEAVEQMYNEYQTQKAYLSQTARNTREELILSREKEAIKLQQDIFSPEGTLMKKRIELIKPIQDAVFKVISTYASTNGYDMVIDIATNPSILYVSPLADKSDEIIKIVKQQ